jgi:hypothetical protein
MIVGRNPRTPVIGDTVPLRAGNRQASSSTQTRLGTEAIGAMGGANFRGTPPRVGRPPTRLRMAMAVTYRCLPVRMIAVFLEASEVRK